MSVSYKKLQHLMIEKEISNAELMRRANISANIISKIKEGKYIALDKVESICRAMDCGPSDMMDFIEKDWHLLPISVFFTYERIYGTPSTGNWRE